MKKNILLLPMMLLLCMAMLWGCGQKNDETPQIPAVYWNADRGIERVAEADGSYNVLFILNGQQTTLRITDKTLLDFLDLHDAVGLSIDDSGTVTAVSALADMPQYYLLLDNYVQSVGKTSVKFNAHIGFSGKETVLTYEEGTPIIDVSDFAAEKGEATFLQKGDGVTVLANPDGSVNTFFVNKRQGIHFTEKRYCPLCETEVNFSNWFSTVSMPNAPGHYFIEHDLNMSAATYAGVAGDITLDLNGKTITMVKEGQRFYTLGEGVILNLIDTVGNGRAVVASAGNGPYKAGMFVRQEGYGCEFNFYSGTLDGTNAVCDYGCLVDNFNGTLNVYGGTMLGGTTYGVGGGAIIVQNLVNIYGGEIIGGNCADLGGYKNNPPGGGAIRHNGNARILNIYGGVIRDGTTEYRGGCIFANGITNIYGGTITGGSADMAGGGLYVDSGATLTISGDVTIADNENGNLYFHSGKTMAVGEAGLGQINIGVSGDAAGTFTSTPVPSDKISGFTADTGKIVKNSNGTLGIK